MDFPVLAGRDGHGEGGWGKLKRVEVRACRLGMVVGGGLWVRLLCRWRRFM